MQAKLRPRHHLAKLLQRSESARQRHERTRQVGHERLALVHGADDVELREPVVPDLPRHNVLWNDSHRLAARPQHGVRDDTHQTHIAPAVPQPNISSHQFPTHLLSGSAVFGAAALTGAAENTDSSHADILNFDWAE